MRRLLVILGRVGLGILLLLSLCAFGTWVGSYFQKETWCRWRYSKPTDETKLLRIACERGNVELTFLRTKYPPGVAILEEGAQETKLTVPGFTCSYPNGWWKFNGGVSPPSLEHGWEHLGLFVRFQQGLRWTISPGVGSYTYLGAPLWLLFVLLISGPALYAQRWWKSRKRFREGRCLKCGYDLRETRDRCPECGAVAGGVKTQIQ